MISCYSTKFEKKWQTNIRETQDAKKMTNITCIKKKRLPELQKADRENKIVATSKFSGE